MTVPIGIVSIGNMPVNQIFNNLNAGEIIAPVVF